MSSPNTGVLSRTADFAHPKRVVSGFGLEPGMKVADFGAGSGAYVLAIADWLNNSGTVYAFDVQKDLLTRVKNDAHRAGYRNVEVIWADLEVVGSTKLVSHHVDLVVVSNLLFQLEDKLPPLVEAHRILKPRGKLVIIDWSESFGGLGPIRDHVVAEDAAREFAKDAGFEFLHEVPVGAHHYGLMFRPEPRSLK